jgi:hypothetical protein
MGADTHVVGVVGREPSGQFQLLEVADLQVGDIAFVVSVSHGVVVVTAAVRDAEREALADFLAAQDWEPH